VWNTKKKNGFLEANSQKNKYPHAAKSHDHKINKGEGLRPIEKKPLLSTKKKNCEEFLRGSAPGREGRNLYKFGDSLFIGGGVSNRRESPKEN